MAHIDHAIIGDPKYFNKENWQLPGGIQKKLQSAGAAHRGAAFRAAVSSTPPRRCRPHMLQSWNLLGLEADRFDPIENAPED